MRGWLVLALVLVFATGAMACGGRGHRRANVRACFANQKTLLGAIEMYNLDKNCRVEEHLERLEDPLAFLGKNGCSYAHVPATEGGIPRVFFLASSFLERLKNEGYLQSVPRDPGQPDAKNYALTSFGNGMICMFHGDIAGAGDTPARSRLRALGVRNPYVLSRASDKNPRHEPVSEDPYFPLAVIAVGAAFLWTFGRMAGDPESSACERLVRSFVFCALATLLMAPMGLFGFEVIPLTTLAWQLGCAGAAVLVGTGRGIASFWSTDAGPVDVEPARPRSHHPVPLLAPRGLKCAVCSCADGPALWVTCPACDAAHHGECWTFQEGCAAFGCTMSHGRWKTSSAVPRRTVARDEPEKGALRWVE